jgi:hypothetical protein
MAAPTSPDPIHPPSRRLTLGLVFGLCVVAALLWIATG